MPGGRAGPVSGFLPGRLAPASSGRSSASLLRVPGSHSYSLLSRSVSHSAHRPKAVRARTAACDRGACGVLTERHDPARTSPCTPFPLPSLTCSCMAGPCLRGCCGAELRKINNEMFPFVGPVFTVSASPGPQR